MRCQRKAPESSPGHKDPSLSGQLPPVPACPLKERELRGLAVLDPDARETKQPHNKGLRSASQRPGEGALVTGLPHTRTLTLGGNPHPNRRLHARPRRERG